MILEDGFAGVLVGLAVGDALGGPVEEIPNHPSRVPRPISDMVVGGYLRLLPGQVTDDTEMALCIAQSIAEKKDFDPADIAQRFIHWFDTNPLGVGGTTRRAIKRLKEGYAWHEAAQIDYCKNSLGNGSVMRCAPIAMYDALHSNELVLHSKDQGIITHPNPECVGSTIFLNTILASLLQGNKKDEAYKKGLHAIVAEDALHERYRHIPTLTTFGVSGEVKATTESAVHCFLSTASFEEAVLKAVNMGGDADTRGAVTGALAGAYYGEDSIPRKWKYKLMDRHTKPIYHELVAVNLSLYELASRE